MLKLALERSVVCPEKDDYYVWFLCEDHTLDHYACIPMRKVNTGSARLAAQQHESVLDIPRVVSREPPVNDVCLALPPVRKMGEPA
jgi:hypothetical protein